MKTDGLFIIMAFIFVYAAWIATGGPSRPVAKQGPFLTPVTRTGEESQGYHISAPSNEVTTGAYPRQVASTTRATTTQPYYYNRKPSQ